jgi:hypothetical protein
LSAKVWVTPVASFEVHDNAACEKSATALSRPIAYSTNPTVASSISVVAFSDESLRTGERFVDHLCASHPARYRRAAIEMVHADATATSSSAAMAMRSLRTAFTSGSGSSRSARCEWRTRCSRTGDASSSVSTSSISAIEWLVMADTVAAEPVRIYVFKA